jgi:ketosteroid isomerase-like protein
VAVSSDGTTQSQKSGIEQTLWSLERAYWRFVEDNDLRAYQALWHRDFTGWPSISAAPVTKDHITDWITSRTSKGLAFKTGEFKPAAIHVAGDVVVIYYWITATWRDKAGKGEAQTSRIAHTWVREGKEWQIIGGMSMPENAAP